MNSCYKVQPKCQKVFFSMIYKMNKSWLIYRFMILQQFCSWFFYFFDNKGFNKDILNKIYKLLFDLVNIQLPVVTNYNILFYSCQYGISISKNHDYVAKILLIDLMFKKKMINQNGIEKKIDKLTVNDEFMRYNRVLMLYHCSIRSCHSIEICDVEKCNQEYLICYQCLDKVKIESYKI